jgi:VMA21-like domain
VKVSLHALVSRAPGPVPAHGFSDAIGDKMPGMTRTAGANLALCSLALFIVPLTVFFAVRHGAIDAILHRLIRGEVTTWARTVWGAILAVLTVNAVLITFVLTAFNETPEETAKKQD